MNTNDNMKINEQFLIGNNIAYIEDLFAKYLDNASSVSDEWQNVFKNLDGRDFIPYRDIKEQITQKITPSTYNDNQSEITRLVENYRTHGHLNSNINPINSCNNKTIHELDLNSYNFKNTPNNIKLTFNTNFSKKGETLSNVIKILKKIYCGSIGVEYKHIYSYDEKNWIESKLEKTLGKYNSSPNKQKQILKELVASEHLEKHLHRKYFGQKRFSLEGGLSLIPLLQEIIYTSSDLGVKEVILGMAHRGRLNVLINVMGKSLEQLFKEFDGENDDNFSGDVKYHKGFSTNLNISGKNLHLSLAFNPSHLEIIAPVVQGSVRSRLELRNSIHNKNIICPVIIHGDASFAGQGVVMETLNFSQARGYTTGGTVHIIINNQIGFTTSNALEARSTLYCSDLAKMIEAPIFHVNGNDPDAVIFVAKLAIEYRIKFQKDVVIDMVCYRKHGHNEVDDPTVTQPMMYKLINEIPSTTSIYKELLLERNVVDKKFISNLNNEYNHKLFTGQKVIDTNNDNYNGDNNINWDMLISSKWDDPYNSKVSKKIIKELGNQLSFVPKGFVLHSTVKKIVDERHKMSNGKIPINWGFAETMAYATLLNEGYSIRISGQDSCRGTFFHRHSVFYDYNNGNKYVPLRNLDNSKKNNFTIINSILSEEAVLAFEYGYASTNPTGLVIWEAQFGDFANGAQVVFDQFISSGEQKWGRLCSLVMFLPHGYEGQGPEHSSARLERYLQSCAQHNIQVCVPSTPTQIFHLLRRQAIRNYKKPLVVLTPKSLLRNKLAISSLDELTKGCFNTILPEIDELPCNNITKIVICSGKVYYELLEARREKKIKNIAMIRIEQLYPFPGKELRQVINKYKNAKIISWCQEEPQNQGAWFSTQHHLKSCLSIDQALEYEGRPFSASPAVGSYKLHLAEQKELINSILK